MFGAQLPIAPGDMQILLASLALAFTSSPASPSALEPNSIEKPRTEPLGLKLGLAVTSIFNDRGTNLLSARGQGEHQLALVPSLRFALRGTGVYMGYLGVYKVAGRDPDVGTNAFQVVSVGYQREVLAETLTLDGGLQLVVLPMADAEAMPTVLEPVITVRWTGPLEVSLLALYSHAIPSAMASNRYVYVQPRIARAFGVTDGILLRLQGSVGYKFYQDPGSADRLLDVATQMAVDFPLGPLVISPAVNLAWVDLEDASFEGEYMAWGSLGAGWSL